jgi:hypothetical protein
MEKVFEQYADWPSFVETVEKMPSHGEGGREHRDGWAGTVTIAQAFELARTGDPAALAVMPQALARAQALTKRQPAPAKRFDVAGGYPIVARMVAGNPLNMVRKARSARASCPVLRLLINQGALSGVTAPQRINRGVAILAHVAAIQESGIQCQIDLTWCAESGIQHRIDCRIKDAGGLFDLTTLSFAIANPAAHRRFAFARRSLHPAMSSSMGSTRDIKPEEYEAGTIYYPAVREYDSQWSSIELAVQYIEEFTTLSREAASQLAA